MSDERDWTIEVNDHGHLLYPMAFHGWPTLTDQPAAAKRYTEAGAQRMVARIHEDMPHWQEHISVVRHPVEAS